MPLDEIRVSPLSRAYTFSDSIYEVIPYYSGKSLCLDSLANAFLLDKSSKGIHPINSWKVLETIISDLENSLLSN